MDEIELGKKRGRNHIVDGRTVLVENDATRQDDSSDVSRIAGIFLGAFNQSRQSGRTI